ncbi:hypothetical protein D3C87_2062900 [compost metagenome]
MFLVVPGVQVRLGVGQHIGFDDVVPRRILAGGGTGQVQSLMQHTRPGAWKVLGQARLDFR